VQTEQKSKAARIAIAVTCANCSRLIEAAVAGNVRCSCGYRFAVTENDVSEQARKQKDRKQKCIHLGPQVGTADCDCQTKPRVYACSLHGLVSATNERQRRSGT
jgi:hypothetical protein